MDQELRGWQPDTWFDKAFLLEVPVHARKEFLQSVRPVSNELSAKIVKSLFAGIKHPFDYVRAGGWMGQLLHAGSDLPDSASLAERCNYLRANFAWARGDLVFLEYHQPTVYVTRWESFLHWFNKGFINRDTMLICHPKAREVILFWEEHGPFFGKRGHRELPCPIWEGPR